MEDAITRREHEEFSKRMSEENERQNKRIDLLEQSILQVNDLISSVKILAVNMENMLTEQKKQGDRLEKLESRDGEKWRTVTSYILTLIIGALISYGLSKVLL